MKDLLLHVPCVLFTLYKKKITTSLGASVAVVVVYCDLHSILACFLKTKNTVL